MRIPVYQTQTGYVRSYARDIAPARPLPEASGKKEYADLLSVAGIMRGIYELPSLLNRTGEAYERSKNAWKNAWGKLQQHIVKGEQRSDLKKNSGASRSGKRVFSSVSEPLSAEAEGIAFSSPLRAQQLRFVREKAFEGGADKKAGTFGPAEKLDEYFTRTAAYSPVGVNGEDLLSQDYVLLRREVEETRRENLRRLEEENFNRGAGTFVQTAALARTPRVLEAYIDSNLAAAQREALACGWSAQQWEERAQTLRAQALRHNVEAALQAGEAARADAVYRRFAARLPQEERELLEHKLTARKADLLGEKLWPQARKECTDGQGRVLEKELQRFAGEAAPEENEKFRRELAGALQARLQWQHNRDLRRRADAYGRLALAEAGTDLSALMASEVFDAREFERNCRALRKLQTGTDKASSAPVFNRLYEAAAAGSPLEEETEKALEGGDISARDYWRLKSRNASVQAGESTLPGRLLDSSVRRFCRLNALSPEETDEVRYFVFTSGDDIREQTSAAHTVKELFLLQESKQ